jgi:magnesium transporter
MQQIVHRSDHPPFIWLDVTAPSEEELHELASKHLLHAAAVQDCLDPEHLPQYERFGETSSLILRVHDPAASDSAGTVQEPTRKIAIFSQPDLTLTIHRTDLAVVADARGRFGGPHPESECGALTLLAALVNGALDSYDRTLHRAEEQIEAFEEALFRRDTDPRWSTSICSSSESV